MTRPRFMVPIRTRRPSRSAAMQVMNFPGRSPLLTWSHPVSPRRKRPSPRVPTYSESPACRTTCTFRGDGDWKSASAPQRPELLPYHARPSAVPIQTLRSAISMERENAGNGKGSAWDDETEYRDTPPFHVPTQRSSPSTVRLEMFASSSPRTGGEMVFQNRRTLNSLYRGDSETGRLDGTILRK